MKCFYHPQLDAVAICKNCHKGLCADCAADLGNGVACKGHCETELAALLDIQQRNKSVFGTAASHFARGAILLAVIGLLFSTCGIYWWTQGGWFYLIIGAVGLLGAIFMSGTARKYRSIN